MSCTGAWHPTLLHPHPSVSRTMQRLSRRSVGIVWVEMRLMVDLSRCVVNFRCLSRKRYELEPLLAAFLPLRLPPGRLDMSIVCSCCVYKELWNIWRGVDTWQPDESLAHVDVRSLLHHVYKARMPRKDLMAQDDFLEPNMAVFVRM